MLTVYIGRQLTGLGKILLAPTDVVLSPHDVVVPDLLFVSSERLDIVAEENVQGAPDLIVEVLSKRTRQRDEGLKLHLYERCLESPCR
jgi:Uma2 family endonuclease